LEFYECEVMKELDKTNSNLRFENCGYNIRHKEVTKKYIKYDCLLTNINRLKLKKSEVFKLIKDSKKAYNGDIYTIYCDGAVYNYGSEKDTFKLSVLTTIVFKNDNEIFRTTEVYEQFLDNNTVEILALLIGLRYLNKHEDKLALKKSKILVSSDSQNLQEYIIRPKIIKIVIKKCKSEKGSSYYSELMRELLNELYFYLSFLNIYSGWVKGHCQIKVNSDRATLMNYTCDKLCREALKKKLHELKVENLEKRFTKKGGRKSNGKVKHKKHTDKWKLP